MYNQQQPWDYQAMQGYGAPQQHVGMPNYQMPQQPMNMGYPMMPQVPYGQQPVGPGMFPGSPEPVPPGVYDGVAPTAPGAAGMLPMEMSYVENILRLNRGKLGTFYFTYENNEQWNSVIYRGVVEEAGRDHIILRDVETGRHYLLLMVNFDYATFDEHLTYDYPFGQAEVPNPELDAYPPR